MLTKREIQMLQASADGQTVKQTAAQLQLSPATVKAHLQRVREKLGAANTAEAIALGFRAGVIW